MVTSTKHYPVEEWRALHRDGWTWIKIAKHYGVNRTAVIRWCRGTYAAQKAASVDNQYPQAVKGRVCNWCRDHYPDKAKEVDDEG